MFSASFDVRHKRSYHETWSLSPFPLFPIIAQINSVHFSSSIHAHDHELTRVLFKFFCFALPLQPATLGPSLSDSLVPIQRTNFLKTLNEHVWCSSGKTTPPQSPGRSLRRRRCFRHIRTWLHFCCCHRQRSRRRSLQRTCKVSFVTTHTKNQNPSMYFC